MPIYEYRCKDCGAVVEKRQSLSEPPLKTCETCGGSLEKQWSLSGFQFKGAGWYVTDYAGNKDSGAGTEKASTSKSTETAGDASNTKSEPAPIAKKDGGPKKE
jgi:putative FmdB family regulatory protein